MVPSTTTVCLNCGVELNGPFCSHCGQRAIAPNPTTRELIGDAWREISGWDGRFARSFRALLGRPGVLTVEALEGRRARYVSPVRLYLVASVTYFLIAASSPHVGEPRTAQLPGPDKVNIDLLETTDLTPEERAAAERSLQRAPWWIQGLIRPVLTDPAKFRRDFLEFFPRVFFVLVPLFAAIVALFYRGRRFPQHLLFALHLHAAGFTALAISEIIVFTRNVIAIGIAEAASLIFIASYVLLGSRQVYRERWLKVILKTLAIAVCYLFAGLIGMFVAFAIVAYA